MPDTVSIPPQPADDATALSAEDRRLLDACLAGDDGAWEAFVGRFAGLFAFVASRTAHQRGLSLSATDRDDIMADILLECLRSDAAVMRSFAGRASLATYLTVIARRVTVRALLRNVTRTASPSALSVDSAPGPDEAARIADREHVESLLAGLDGDEARLVRLHHLEQRSYGEISHLTGMPLGSIGPALSRAREKMRQLEQHSQAG
ncbi:MAG: RNA polymerase sigma factor [Planctomycetia bacterium]|nr:RNA polymerase sigma factor [Planctomycetia bacterium]